MSTNPRRLLITLLLLGTLLAGCAAPAAAPVATPVPPTATPIPPTATPVPPTPTPAPPEAAGPDPVAVVQAWHDVLNHGDLDGALALMTEDVKISGWRPPVRNVLDWWIDIKTHFGVQDCQQDGEQLACDVIMTDDGCITASGNTHGLQLRHIFSLQDGKIHEVSYGEVANTEDWDRYGKWLEGEGAWASAYRAEESSKTDRNVSSDAGEVAIKLCQDYADFLGRQVPAISASAQALVDAINSGDIDTAVALLTDDAKVTFRNDKAAGKDQLSSLFNWLAGKETQYQITDCVWQGDKLACSVSIVDGCIAASSTPDGLPGMMIIYALEDGTLRNVADVLSFVERKPYETWLEAEAAWASANRADELAQAEGYSQAAGEMAVQLCQEYAATMQAQAQDSAAVIHVWFDAISNGDLDAAMALMTPDAVITGTGAPNRPARNVVDWWIDMETHFGAPDCQQAGDQLVCDFMMTDHGCTVASGYTVGESMRYTFDMQDGKIHRLDKVSIESVGSDVSRHYQWLEEEMAWASVNHAEELAGIDWDGFSTGGGDIVVKLCQEYAETLK